MPPKRQQGQGRGRGRGRGEESGGDRPQTGGRGRGQQQQQRSGQPPTGAWSGQAPRPGQEGEEYGYDEEEEPASVSVPAGPLPRPAGQQQAPQPAPAAATNVPRQPPDQPKEAWTKPKESPRTPALQQEPIPPPQQEPTPAPVQQKPPQQSQTAAHAAALTEKLKGIQITVADRKQFRPPDRPDAGGRLGRPIRLAVNCWDMRIPPDLTIYLYDLEFLEAEGKGKDGKPRIIERLLKNKTKKRQIVETMLSNKNRFPNFPMFDGGRIIFTRDKIPQITEVPRDFPYMYNDPEEPDPIKCKFRIQLGGQFNTSELMAYIDRSRPGSSTEVPMEPIRVMDTLLRIMMLNLNYFPVGRKAFFNPKPRLEEMRCGKFSLHEGFFTSVRPQRWCVRLNIDKTQTVVYKACNVIELVQSLDRHIRVGQEWTESGRKGMEKKLKMLRIEASHYKNDRNQNYTRRSTIFGLSRLSARKYKIADLNLTVETYFAQHYGIQLQHPNWPCLKTAKEKDTFIPMELATLMPYQSAPSKNGQIVQEVIRHAAVPAFERRATLENHVRSLGFSNNAYLKHYAINVNTEMLKLAGRVLQGPQAEFGNQKKAEFRGGKWDMRSDRFYRPAQAPEGGVLNWALLCIGQVRNDAPLFEIQDQLPKMAANVGMRVNSESYFDYIMAVDFERKAREVADGKVPAMKGVKPHFIVVVITYEDVYGSVKRFGDLQYGVITQCLKFDKLEKQRGLQQYLANVMLKVNGKLGGINWRLTNLFDVALARGQRTGMIKEAFMVVGADVTHPSPTERKELKKSVAAVVSSIDQDALQYIAEVRQQNTTGGTESEAAREMIDDMEEIMFNMLKKFHEINRLKPSSIIFYRDGVSEGQFLQVLKHEVLAIQRACHRLSPGGDYQPGLTYIVVKKRHNIRLFPEDQRDACGRSGNIPPGTVADTDITHPREFDFYLCSHDGIQGCSKPAHYHVLWDDNHWGSDDLQKFTFYLCHVYMRCTRSVSYPAPTYYSHLAAFRARSWLGEDDASSSSEQSSVVSGAGRGSQQLPGLFSRPNVFGIHERQQLRMFFL